MQSLRIFAAFFSSCPLLLQKYLKIVVAFRLKVLYNEAIKERNWFMNELLKEALAVMEQEKALAKKVYEKRQEVLACLSDDNKPMKERQEAAMLLQLCAACGFDPDDPVIVTPAGEPAACVQG